MEMSIEGDNASFRADIAVMGNQVTIECSATIVEDWDQPRTQKSDGFGSNQR
jgi:hypothetical protein